jgi:HD-GYP domain-containing protein (c-di-GMP phosphodiesterase class II)
METKVDAKDLKVGMFVADLDRPWIDTPFLLQGFLIEDDQQVRQLQRHCQFVIVDRARSVGDEFAAPPSATTAARSAPGPSATARGNVTPLPGKPAAATSPARAPEPRAGVRADGAHANVTPLGRRSANGGPRLVVPPPPAREHAPGGSLLGGLMDRVRGMLKRPVPTLPEDPADLARDAIAEKPAAPIRPSVLPPDVPFTIYEEAVGVEEEIGSARQAFTRSSDELQKLAADVWAGHPVQIERVEEVVDDMVESMVRNPDALMWVTRLRERDRTVYGHGLQVAVYLVAFGRHLGYPKPGLAQLGTIGLLLDIGKIRLPRELLEKHGRLSSGEFETVKAHVAHSLDILEETPNWPVEILEGIAQHHERMNGSGYPKGLKEDEIGLFGRMAGIADCFAALTKSRPYAEAVSSYEALRSISSWGGEFFHAPLVEQFIQAIGVFPVGSLVELSSGEVAVVVSHNKLRRLKPRVLILTAADKTPSAYPVMADLLYDPKLGGSEPAFIRRSLPAGAYGLDPRENYLS